MDLEKYKVPENVKECLILADQYASMSPEYLTYLENAEQLAILQGENLLTALLLSDKAYHYYLNTKINEAINYAKQAVNIAIKINNRKELVRFYCNLSTYSIGGFHLEEAIQYSFEALKLSPSIREKQVIYMNLGIIFRKKKVFQQALDYLNKALVISQQNQKSQRSYLYSNIGNVYLDLQEYDLSILNFKKSLSLFAEKENFTSKLIALEGIGEAFLSQKKWQEAIAYFQKAKIIAEDKQMHVNISHLTFSLGNSYQALKTYTKAIVYFEQSLALAQQYDLKEQLLNTLDALHKTYYLKGNIAKAYAIQSTLLEQKDAFFEEQQKEKMTVLVEKKGREIDVLKEQNEQIKMQNEYIKRQNAELKQYAHIIAHDLQEPLRNINGFSTLLKYRCVNELSDTSKEYLNFLMRSSEQMHQQLNALLKYVNLGNMQEHYTEVNLNKVVELMQFALQEDIKQTGAIINCPNLPTISAYIDQIQQLFFHLLQNALKFRHPKRISQIDINCKMEKDICFLSITDNGIGIQKEYLEKIFTIFNRIDKNKYAGTGIGLSICQKIVNNHNGNIKAESNGTHGTCISFTLKSKS